MNPRKSKLCGLDSSSTTFLSKYWYSNSDKHNDCPASVRIGIAETYLCGVLRRIAVLGRIMTMSEQTTHQTPPLLISLYHDLDKLTTTWSPQKSETCVALGGAMGHLCLGRLATQLLNNLLRLLGLDTE